MTVIKLSDYAYVIAGENGAYGLQLLTRERPKKDEKPYAVLLADRTLKEYDTKEAAGRGISRIANALRRGVAYVEL